MEEGSEWRECFASQPGSLGNGREDTRTDVCRCDTEGECEVKLGRDGRQQRSFSDTRCPAAGVTSLSLSCTALYTSNADVCTFKQKQDSLSCHQRSCSLDDMSNNGLRHRDVYAFCDKNTHRTGADGTCEKLLQEVLSVDDPDRTSISRPDLELCKLHKDNVNASIARQRSPSWVLLEHPDDNIDSTSAFVDDYTPRLVTEHLVDQVHVHSFDTDILGLDHLSLNVTGQENSVCDIVIEDDGQCPRDRDSATSCIDIDEQCQRYGDSGAAGIDTVISDYCEESPSDDEPKLSSPQEELIYKRDCSEGSMSSPGDSDTACAVVTCPHEVTSPGGTDSTESLYDSLTDYDTVISGRTTETDHVLSPAASGAGLDPTSVCSPSCSSGAVSRTQPVFPAETLPLVSPVTISQDTLHWVSVKRRPTSLQVTPMYVHHVLPPALDSTDRETEATSPGNDTTNPVLRDAEVPHHDDHSSSGSSNQTCNTSRYSWPASQPVQLRSRSCARLRRKHVKSAIMTSAVDMSGSTSLSRRFHSQLLPLTKSTSLGYGMYQNARWGCPMTSARLNDSRKSEKFIMSLKKDGVLKPRTQPRCRHKRHSYHVTAGPCVTCTNHTNSLGPCFVLGVGQCNLCQDSGRSGRSADAKEASDHPLVELDYVVPKCHGETGGEHRKVVERADSTVRNEMQQYTREKLRQRSKEDLLVLVEHFSRQARVVSEELVQLLQQKHDFIEQIEMRKVAIEQLLRLQMETK